MARSGSISRLSPNTCCRQSVRPISPARTWPWAQCVATCANLQEVYCQFRASPRQLSLSRTSIHPDWNLFENAVGTLRIAAAARLAATAASSPFASPTRHAEQVGQERAVPAFPGNGVELAAVTAQQNDQLICIAMGAGSDRCPAPCGRLPGRSHVNGPLLRPRPAHELVAGGLHEKRGTSDPSLPRRIVDRVDHVGFTSDADTLRTTVGKQERHCNEEVSLRKVFTNLFKLQDFLERAGARQLFPLKMNHERFRRHGKDVLFLVSR